MTSEALTPAQHIAELQATISILRERLEEEESFTANNEEESWLPDPDELICVGNSDELSAKSFKRCFITTHNSLFICYDPEHPTNISAWKFIFPPWGQTL